MYKLADTVFYDVNDRDQFMADIYYTTLSQHPDPEIQKLKSNYMTAFYSLLNTHSKQIACDVLNMRITELQLPKYEEHWIKMLKGYGFDAYTYHLNGIEAASLQLVGEKLSSDNPDESWKLEIKDYLMHNTGERYLCIPVISSTIADDTGMLSLNAKIIMHFVDSFGGSFFDKDQAVLYIKYAPMKDIRGIIYLTNNLHYFL